VSEDKKGIGSRRSGAEMLRRRIEEMRAVTGHPLRCRECDRVSSGRATGWTMRLDDDGCPYALCPECDELAFG